MGWHVRCPDCGLTPSTRRRLLERAGVVDDAPRPTWAEVRADVEREALDRMLTSRARDVDAPAELGRVRIKRIARPRAHDRRPAASDAQRELEWGEYDPRQRTLPWAPRRGSGDR